MQGFTKNTKEELKMNSVYHITITKDSTLYSHLTLKDKAGILANLCDDLRFICYTQSFIATPKSEEALKEIYEIPWVDCVEKMQMEHKSMWDTHKEP